MPTDISTAPVTIRLGGKTRELRYTTSALSHLEQELGESLFSILEGATSGVFSVRHIVAFVWAGLLHAYPRNNPRGALTTDAVADLMDASYGETPPLQMMTLAMEALARAGVISGLSAEDDDEGAEGNAEAAPL